MDLRTINNEVEALRKTLDAKHSQWCLCITIPSIAMKSSTDNKVIIMPIAEIPRRCPNLKTIDIEEIADALFDKVKTIDDMNKFELRLLQIITGTKDNKEIVKRIRAAVRYSRLKDAELQAEWEARDKQRGLSSIHQAPTTPVGDSKEICYNDSTNKEPSKPKELSMDEIMHKIAKDFGD